jgi:hypothetical protein
MGCLIGALSAIIAGVLPSFDEYGNLPPGIHPARIEEIVGRFGHGSVEREVEIRELAELTVWAREHGVRRLIVNGSFVTDKAQPNDVDVVILPRISDSGGETPMDLEPSVWPFLQILVAADDADLDRWATDDFGTDREGRHKGVVEVIL